MIAKRIMAIDYGDVRVGIAVSDPSLTLASPLVTLKNDSRLIDAVMELIQEYDIEKIIVGYPLNLKGQEGFSTEKVDKFIQKLDSTGLQIERWDERFSSVTAINLLHEAGANLRKDKGRVDRSAAAIILQEYLDSL